VLERISSHVGGFNDDGPDMLGLYMSSLERVGRLPVKRVLPGHGPAFDRLAERVTELQEHHMVRTGEALAAFKGRPLPALEVASQISWLDQRDGWDRLGRTSRMMALSETVAHLRHLEATGQVISTRDGSGVLLYRRA
jgi:glyoxylase-like metal-dependent hydrolase (beta-lactamase superfamily II)